MNSILKTLNDFDTVSHALYTECSPLNVSRLWTADVNSTLAVGEEVNFYCSNDPSLLMATVKCRQSGLWKITHRSLANTHQCNRIGEYQLDHTNDLLFTDKLMCHYVLVCLRVLYNDLVWSTFFCY